MHHPKELTLDNKNIRMRPKQIMEVILIATSTNNYAFRIATYHPHDAQVSYGSHFMCYAHGITYTLALY